MHEQYDLFGRSAAVHVAVRPGLIPQVILAHLQRRVRLGRHQLLDIAIQPAAVRETHLEPVKPALPFLYSWLWALTMLQEKKSAAGSQNPVHLAQGLLHVLDAAQRPGTDDTIKCAVLK